VERQSALPIASAQRWCILRTSPGRTLGLAASLADAGLDVWTPTVTQSRRVPRSKQKREVEAPIMPTFVFARAEHIADLTAILALPLNPHPAFSIFRHAGRIPLIADGEIAGARAEEDKGKRTKLKAHRHLFAPGTAVSITEGVGLGMSGVVEQGDGKFALVCFGGRMAMKIATFLLRTDEVQAAPLPGPEAVISGTAAKAA
jgi:hypothetical protein